MYKDEKFILLPEIQFDYAVLHFKDVVIPRKVRKMLKQHNYILTINERFDEVINKIKNYHKNSWLTDEYIGILNNIRCHENINKNFKLMSIELVEKETNELISGELGYKVGEIYTSLTGFTTREKKYNNWGKLQLILLNQYLEDNGYKVWNLGHPQLQYKIDLGARIYNRKDFLALWKEHI